MKAFDTVRIMADSVSGGIVGADPRWWRDTVAYVTFARGNADISGRSSCPDFRALRSKFSAPDLCGMLVNLHSGRPQEP
jgi:hypothetical protein